MIKDKLPSLPPSAFRLPPSALIAPFSSLYGLGMSLRAALYHRGILRRHTLPAPVISVGNITTGGTGKTPLVRWLAENLAPYFTSQSADTTHQTLHAPLCILSRGYGRQPSSNGKLERVVVSDGYRILACAAQGGDEPRLLAEGLLNIAAVISDADRVAAARWAHAHFGTKLFILDDGFQHLRVRRDFDAVAVDATNPFGGGRMLPRGRLREPLSSLRRADAIVLTRAEQVADVSDIITRLKVESRERPIFIARTHTGSVLPLECSASLSDSGDLMEQPIAALCAIGNPKNFVHHLTREGYQVRHTSFFPDHHRYTQTDVATFERQARLRGARAILTTTKDAVKLRGMIFTMPCFIVEIEFAIDEAERLLQMISGKLNKRMETRVSN